MNTNNSLPVEHGKSERDNPFQRPVIRAIKAMTTNRTAVTNAPPVARQFTQTSNSDNDIRLILIRGLPGSGKSELGKALAITAGYFHIEADMFFEINGSYNYDAKQVGAAHKWCQKSAHDALASGKRVVVTNTFTRLAELDPYLAMGVKPRIVEAAGKWKNRHGVPDERLRQMADRWEPLPKVPRTT